VLTGAARRRVFGEYQATSPSRFIGEIPSDLVKTIAPAWSPAAQGSFSHSHYEFRTNPYGRGGRGPNRVREAADTAAPFAYEDEDQSLASVKPGMRVRHPQFGVGTVVAVEAYNDDEKVTVRFLTVGQKKLMSRFARLEPA
jgi:DNA helicase-2/ATP-dependent DNA helicase PcrA